MFYNGKDVSEKEIELKLSDAFVHSNEHSAMELKARVLNINYGHNQKLMEQCKTLQGYSIFVAKVKKYVTELGLLEAINRAIDECLEEDVLTECLLARRSDVVNALMTEYDEEKVLADLSREYFEDGEEKGRLEGRQEGRQEGQTRLNKLTKRLARDGRMDDIIQGAENPEYQELLLKEYGL